MLQINTFSKLIPSYRWTKKVKTSIKQSFLIKKTVQRLSNQTINFMGRRPTLHRISFSKNLIIRYNLKPLTIPYVVINILYVEKYTKCINYIKDIFDRVLTYPNSNFLYPGRILISRFKKKKALLGFCGTIVPLNLIPINTYISFIFDNLNVKSTYACAGGSRAIRQKIIKKNKLIKVKLPSLQSKYFSSSTNALFGIRNTPLNKIVEGSWGKTTRSFKKIEVRGVAKNPVDHPNGGRTKAKQPERSPWGWVAKFNR